MNIFGRASYACNKFEWSVKSYQAANCICTQRSWIYKSIKLKTSVFVQQSILKNLVESQSNRFTEIFDATNGVNISQFKRWWTLTHFPKWKAIRINFKISNNNKTVLYPSYLHCVRLHVKLFTKLLPFNSCCCFCAFF